MTISCQNFPSKNFIIKLSKLGRCSIVCKYSKLNINILAFLICLIIFSSINFVFKNIYNSLSSIENNFQEQIEVSKDEEKIDTLEETEENITNEIVETLEEQYDWALKIPKIDLYAEISEGTEEEILNQYIGHFSESKKESGNVCLAAHNRGYNVNYFSNLKKLEEGDEIYYYINNNEYKYIVDEILIVYETDWDVIENTEEDRVTLITCIENREKYRLCVRGIRED